MRSIHRLGASAFAVMALALTCVSTLRAQTEPAPKWSVVTITTIKPDMRTEYEAWQKQLTAAYKKAEVPSRAVLQTVMGDLFEYVSVAPIAHFADLDGLTPVEKALGKDPAANLMKKGSAYLTSARRMATLDMEELTIRNKTEPAPFAVVTIMRLASGKAPEFTAWMKDEYLPAMKKAELKNFWVSRTVFGGDPNERVTVRPMKALSEIDAGPLTVKALGEEGSRKLMSHTAGIVESVQFRIMKYRPDLSYELAAPVKSASAK